MLKIRNLDDLENMKGICNPTTFEIWLPKDGKTIAKELGISKWKLKRILKGKKTCDSILKTKILTYFPDATFVLTKERYKIEKI